MRTNSSHPGSPGIPQYRRLTVIAGILVFAASLFADLSPGRAAVTEYPSVRITAVNRANAAGFDSFIALRARLASPLETHYVSTAALHAAITPLFSVPIRRFISEPPPRLSTRPAPGLPLLMILQRSCIWHQSTDSDPASRI